MKMNMLFKTWRGKTLLLLMLFTLMSGSVWAYHFKVNGIYYNITDATNLTVEVTYETTDYNSYNGPIVIPASVAYDAQTYTVTAIGENAFKNCSTLTAVTIGSGVTTIGGYAFSGCSGLTSITIPNGVTAINNYAFENCTSLAEINFNATNCTTIGYNFGNQCWNGCTHDCTLNIGDNVTSLPTRAFAGFSKLIVINFGTHADFSIGESAFSGCGVTTVVIPDNVTSIGKSAFDGCLAMTSLTIGTGVTFINEWAFKNCNHLETVYYNATACSYGDQTIYNQLSYPAWDGAGNGTTCTLIIGNNVTSLPEKYAFYKFTGLTSVTIGTNPYLTTIPQCAFANCTSLATISIPSNVTTIKSGAFQNCSAATSLDLGSVTTIENYAFDGCSGLPAINIPNTVTSLGDRNAFSGCSAATSLSLGTGITAIPPGTFYGCSSLGSLTIPANVTSIVGATDASGAFENCTSLTALTIPNTITGIGYAAFRGCTGLASVFFGTGLTTISSEAFNGCTSLAEVTTGTGVTTIGYRAFNGCTSLASVTISAGVTDIGSNAFRGCTSLATVNYNATNCTNTPSGTGESFNIWYGCYNLRTLNVGENVTSLPQNIFYNAEITAVNFLGDNPQLTTIGNGALTSTNITSIDIPNGVTSIGSDAFHYCYNLTSVTIPDNVTTIGSSAFEYCTAMKKIVIGSGVTTMGEKAFISCAPDEIWLKTSTPPTIQANTFLSSSKTLTSTPVLVPKGSKTTYEAATNWSNFTNIQEFLRFTGTGANPMVWSQSDNWVPNETPASNEAAWIEANVTIFDGVATASRIFLDNNATLIIKDGGQLVCNSPVEATLEKEIDAWIDGQTPGGWYFIASPVEVDPKEIDNMITGYPKENTYDFDLYYYDESGYTWRNYKQEAFELIPTYGYLCAEERDVQLLFTGTMPAANAEITVTQYLSNTAPIASVKGFNLMGNPYTHNLTAGDVKVKTGDEYADITTYYMVENGTEITAVQLSETPIMPGRGFMVQATAVGQQLVFNHSTSSKGETSKVGYISIAAGNDDFTDNAFVQMGGGNTLQKMTLGDSTPKVYLQQGNGDYAAVTVDAAQKEIPVGFKAVENGTYTIDVNVKGLEIDYLHLVDHLTGADVDLLATPSYQFTAKKSDYASRFKLVFHANGIEENTEDDEEFAFFSDGEIIINGEGMVQVFDVLGHQLYSHEANSASRIPNSEFAPGVYVLRLMNGEHVRTQKIVIK